MQNQVLVCPQLKDLQFVSIDDERNHKISTFKKLCCCSLNHRQARRECVIILMAFSVNEA